MICAAQICTCGAVATSMSRSGASDSTLLVDGVQGSGASLDDADRDFDFRVLREREAQPRG
jgi:hypothetical protein